MTTRVAAVDCGTNSARLLVADVTDGRVADVVRLLRINRLGQGVDRTGGFDPAALERTRAVLSDYAAIVAAADVAATRVVATSATRDARNRAEFVAMVRDLLGVEPEVVSGEEEARLSFRGAVASLPSLAPPVLLCDIGGGSTELVRWDGGGAVAACSVDIGCVRMTERHLRADPPGEDQVRAAAADVSAALDRAASVVDLTTPATFLGLAGSVTTVAALALGLPAYEELETHGAVISFAAVAAVADRLLAATHAERAAEPVIHEGRTDVIAAGALILRAVMERCGADSVTVSEHDILDGIALSAADRLAG